MLDKVIRRVYNAQCKKKESGDQPMKKTLYSLMLNEEVVREIENQCANNQMRDVFFDEIETDDPEAYIRQKFPDKNLKYEKTVEADGSLVFDIETSGIRQRFTFTEI